MKKRVLDLNLVFEEFVECLDRASKKVYTNNDVNLSFLASNSSSEILEYGLITDRLR